MKDGVESIVGLRGSGLTTQCLTWLTQLLEGGVSPDRVIVLVRNSNKAEELKHRLKERLGNRAAGVAIHGYTNFIYSQLAQFWAQVCQLEPSLPPTFQPRFLTKDLTQFLLSCAFDRCPLHFQYFKDCPLPEYKVLDQILSDSYIAHSACLPVGEIGKRLANSWIDQENKTHKQMLSVIPCCLDHLRKTALEHQVIDFGYQFELFHRVLLQIDRFWQTWDYLIADNAEESNGVFLRFYEQAVVRGKKLFFAYTLGGGSTYATRRDAIVSFLIKNGTYKFTDRYLVMGELGIRIAENLGANLKFPIPRDNQIDFTDRVKLFTTNTYQDAIDTTIHCVKLLLEKGVSPDRVAILMPKFDQVLMQLFLHDEIGKYCSFPNPYVSFLRYPAVTAMLTCAQLVNPHLVSAPNKRQISGMVSFCLGIDPIRAILLVDAFDPYNLCLQQRVSPRVDQLSRDKFNDCLDRLQSWRNQSPNLYSLWVEFLREFSPNFRLTNTDRQVIKNLMTTARRFYDAFPNFSDFQFMQMLLSGQTPTILPPWDYEHKIMVATPLAFLNTDRVTDYQVWFNIGAREWRKPIGRALFNPVVLMPDWKGDIYTNEKEQELRTAQLGRTLLNLCCRNQQEIYLIKSLTSPQGQDNYTNLDGHILRSRLPK